MMGNATNVSGRLTKVISQSGTGGRLTSRKHISADKSLLTLFLFTGSLSCPDVLIVDDLAVLRHCLRELRDLRYPTGASCLPANRRLHKRCPPSGGRRA